MKILSNIQCILVILVLCHGCAAATPITKISCTGASELTEGHVYSWLNDNLPVLMSDVDPVDIRDGLMSYLPLADVSVERQWPGALNITVVERKPYAMLLGENGQIVLVDRNARKVTLRNDQQVALWDRPVIRGCVDSHAVVRRNCTQRALGYMTWVDHVKPDWLSQLSEIRVLDEAITAYLNDGTPIYFADGPIAPQIDALAYAWTSVQQHQLKVRSVRIVGVDRVIIRTINDTTGSGA